MRSRLVKIRVVTARSSNGYLYPSSAPAQAAHTHAHGARASGVNDVAQALAHHKVLDLVGRARGAPPARRRPRLLRAGPLAVAQADGPRAAARTALAASRAPTGAAAGAPRGAATSSSRPRRRSRPPPARSAASAGAAGPAARATARRPT
jgi:hypothetical protein